MMVTTAASASAANRNSQSLAILTAFGVLLGGVLIRGQNLLLNELK
jgi:hypothetical protein